MSAGRTFVDTNVLTYLFDDAAPEKQAIARRRLSQEQREREIVVSTQVLQELYVSLTKGRAPIATVEIAEGAVREASGYLVVQIDTHLVISAIAASWRHGLSLWDALIVRAAAEVRCDRLLSEDLNHSQRIDGVRIENPFARPER
jgi:predicted nucleic acid-binding protein